MLSRNCTHLSKFVFNQMVKCRYEKHNISQIVIGFQFEYKLSKRNISWTTCLYQSDDNSSGKENPVLQVISSNIKTEGEKDILKNVKEKSLQVEEEPKQILSTDSIKKLKEKIIGKSEKEVDLKQPSKPPKKRKRVDLSAQSLERNFITPVRAMSDFLLKPSDLESLPKTKRRSPYESEPPITVYWRKDVEAKSLETWGSMDNLQKERLKRDIERKKYQQNIFTVKRRLRDYRREMGKSTEVITEDIGLMGRSGKVVITAVAM